MDSMERSPRASTWRCGPAPGDHVLMNLTRRAAAAALGCLVLVTSAACSDDSQDRSSAGSTAGADTSAGAADFCDVAVESREATSSAGDQTTEEAATSWTTAGAAMESVEAPDEIAEQWETVTSTVVEVGEIFTSGTDAEKAGDTQRLVLAEDFQAARSAVDDYVAQACDS